MKKDWLKGGEEIAGYLGISVVSLCKLRKRYNNLPVIMLLGQLRAHPADLDEWLREKR